MSDSAFFPGRRLGDEAMTYASPPALARLPPGRHRLPQEFVEQNQRNRILMSALSVFGEKGLAAARVQDVIVQASISRATFYKFFSDKEACMAALHDEVILWLAEEARDAGAELDWPTAVRSVSQRLIGLLANDPRIARLCAVEAPLAGDRIRSRHQEALAELSREMRKGRSERAWGGELPKALESFQLAGAVGLIAKIIVYGNRPNAKALARELSEILLIPYLGAEDARRTAGAPA